MILYICVMLYFIFLDLLWCYAWNDVVFWMNVDYYILNNVECDYVCINVIVSITCCILDKGWCHILDESWMWLYMWYCDYELWILHFRWYYILNEC